MAVAIATLKHAHGFFLDPPSPDGGWEYNFVLIGLLGALTLIGTGRWSIDRAIGLVRDETKPAPPPSPAPARVPAGVG